MPYQAHRGRKERKAKLAAELRVRRAENVIIVLFLPALAAVTLVLGTILYWLHLLYVHSRGEVDLLLRPATPVWYIVALPISFCLAVLLYDPINKILIGPEPPSFSISYFMSTSPIPRWLSAGVIVVIVLLGSASLLLVRKHVRFTNSAIIEQLAFSATEQRYPYTRIKDLILAHHYVPASKYSAGGPSRNRAVFVIFDDGSRWSPKDSELPSDPDLSSRIAQYVSAKSGLAIRYPDGVLDLPDPRFQTRGRVLILFFGVAILTITPNLILFLLRRYKSV